MAHIIVRVKRGEVYDIEGVPEGVDIEVRDYDTEGLDDRVTAQDEHGRFVGTW